jgi:hypothetical protein
VCIVLGGCASECSTMRLEIVETGKPPSGTLHVGVGLGLDVGVSVDKGIQVDPEKLAVFPDVETAVVIEYKTIALDQAGQPDDHAVMFGYDVRATPLVAGPNNLVFVADNTDRTQQLDYEALAVTDVRFLDDTLSITPLPPVFSAFKGSELPIFMSFKSGSETVLGRTPLVLDAPPSSNTTYMPGPATPGMASAGYFQIGYQAPYTFTLSTAINNAGLTVNVVDVDAIASLGLDITGPLQLKVNSSKRFYLLPLDATGVQIRGRYGAGLATATVQGSSISMPVVFSDGQVDIQAIAVGQSIVTFTWGTATAQLTVDVTM